MAQRLMRHRLMTQRRMTQCLMRHRLMTQCLMTQCLMTQCLMRQRLMAGSLMAQWLLAPCLLPRGLLAQRCPAAVRLTHACPPGCSAASTIACGRIPAPATPALLGCARVSVMRQQFWFWYGYRPGNRTVARQTLR